jgi:hypothetical protein
MTQADKDLLLKDLCARLPYGVKVQDELGKIHKLVIGNNDLIRLYYNDFSTYSEEKLSLPYLFPLLSMTEKQCYELYSIRSSFQDCWKYIKTPIPLSICNFEQIEWFHKNHFDYRGLIEKGLAIDATGLDIY